MYKALLATAQQPTCHFFMGCALWQETTHLAHEQICVMGVTLSAHVTDGALEVGEGEAMVFWPARKNNAGQPPNLLAAST